MQIVREGGGGLINEGGVMSSEYGTAGVCAQETLKGRLILYNRWSCLVGQLTLWSIPRSLTA